MPLKVGRPSARAHARRCSQLEHVDGTDGLDRDRRESGRLESRASRSPATSSAFPRERLQVLGETEITYLSSLDAETRRAHLATVLLVPDPLRVRHEGTAADAGSRRARGEGGRRPDPLARSRPTSSTRASSRGSRRSSRRTTTLHGSLADVFGVGLLFIGQSGIGKSECVLDLVERGHRLVADDLVIARRRGNDVLIGRGHELQRHHMEIRGVGLVDIPSIFGIRAVRQQKRIEVVVQLEEWDQDAVGRSHGARRARSTTILDVELPKVRVPLNPGKNITVIAEVIAMNHLLKYSGIDPAERFNERLMRADARTSDVQRYLQEDNE